MLRLPRFLLHADVDGSAQCQVGFAAHAARGHDGANGRCPGSQQHAKVDERCQGDSRQ